MSEKTSRKIIKPVKPVRELTGAEDSKFVDPNRIYHYGYKYFLAPEQIREMFGERIAKSKKIRKAKIREVLKNTMHLINPQEFDGTITDFLDKTKTELSKHIIEIQGMPSSPDGISILSNSSVKEKEQTVKRSREVSEEDIDVLAEMLQKKVKVARTKTVPQLTEAQRKQLMKLALKKEKEEAKKKQIAEARSKRAERREEIKEPVNVGLVRMLEKTGL